MKKKFIFKNSQFYEKNIIYFSKNLRSILNKLRLKPKNLQVLDFGCGNCLLHRYIKFRQIFLHDSLLKEFKVPNDKNFKIFKSKIDIYKSKVKFDLIIINSVVQYIRPQLIKILISKLEKKLLNGGIILISDIPQKSRLLEILNLRNLALNLKLLFYFKCSSMYLKSDFFTYKKDFFQKLKLVSKKKYIFLKNLNYINDRYSLLICNAKNKYI